MVSVIMKFFPSPPNVNCPFVTLQISKVIPRLESEIISQLEISVF